PVWLKFNKRARRNGFPEYIDAELILIVTNKKRHFYEVAFFVILALSFTEYFVLNVVRGLRKGKYFYKNSSVGLSR
ncbi:MAG: hypothetical protein VXW48_03985, partial [Pseudomonadota bacterium]|nr:hypothetical protein [Pseudomonadota bacterium]